MSMHVLARVNVRSRKREREEKKKKEGERRGMASGGPVMVLFLLGHCLDLNHRP